MTDVPKLTRPEHEILLELKKLCISSGYAHAIAHFCFRDNIVRFSKDLTIKDMESTFSPDRLIRTEISSLIGLMIKADVDFTLPPPSVLQDYADKTEELLNELHHSLSEGWMTGLNPESTQRSKLDGRTHDVTIAVGTSGLTIHCNDFPVAVAELSLRRHCENRKYSQRANSWYGLCLRSDSTIKFGLNLEYEWEEDEKMEAVMPFLPKPTKFKDFGKFSAAKRVKIGRNDRCPCGSGKKFKKCHGQ